MTNEQLKGLRDAIDAKLAGKDWQWRRNSWPPDEWQTAAAFDGLGVVNDDHQFRAKPEPVYRPWKCAQDLINTAGPLCWLRGKYDDGRADYRVHLVIGLVADMSYNTCAGGCEPICHSASFSETRWQNMEWSSDLKTWHPCTVEEPC